MFASLFVGSLFVIEDVCFYSVFCGRKQKIQSMFSLVEVNGDYAFLFRVTMEIAKIMYFYYGVYMKIC